MTRTLILLSFVVGLCSCKQGSDPVATRNDVQPAAETSIAAVPQPKPKTAYDGPFGLEPALTVDQVRQIVTLEAAPDSPGVYSTRELPKPHPAFESYSLVFSDSQGLCKLIGIGKDIDTGDSGFEVRSAFSELSEAISKKYGQGKKYDLFTGGGSGDMEYWMMNLLGNDRTLATIWDQDSGASLPPAISAISVEAHATRMDKGYLVLSYQFSNFKDCAAELKASQNEVL